MDDDQIEHLIRLQQQDHESAIRILAELDDRVRDLEGGAPVGLATEVAEDDHPHDLAYDTLDVFVEQFVCVVFEEAETPGSGSKTWCGDWSKHPGVVFGLTALWQAFEAARLAQVEEGGGAHLIAWHENYFRPYMMWVTGSQGPFRLCQTGHRDPVHLGAMAS